MCELRVVKKVVASIHSWQQMINQHEKEEVDVRAEGWLSECGSYDRSCSFPLPIGTKTR